jgi:hypothetical protein
MCRTSGVIPAVGVSRGVDVLVHIPDKVKI